MNLAQTMSKYTDVYSDLDLWPVTLYQGSDTSLGPV
jgi:hypothetical protein